MHPPALLSVSRMASHSGSRPWDIYFSALKSDCLQLQSKCAHFSGSVDAGERAPLIAHQLMGWLMLPSLLLAASGLHPMPWLARTSPDSSSISHESPQCNR